MTDGVLDTRTELRGFRPVAGQDAVEGEDRHGRLADLDVEIVEAGLRRGANQAEHEGRHRRDEADAQHDGFPRFGAEVFLREAVLKTEPEEDSAESTGRNEQTDGDGVEHGPGI